MCHERWSPRARSAARLVFALLATRHTSATRAAIGGFLGITGQAGGQLIAVVEERSRTDDHLMRLLATLESELRGIETSRSDPTLTFNFRPDSHCPHFHRSVEWVGTMPEKQQIARQSGIYC